MRDSHLVTLCRVFAVGRNGSSSTAVALGQRVFDQPPRSKVPLAAILGGVLGGVALLGAIGAAIWVYMYYYVGRPRPVRPKAVKPPPPPPPVPQPPPEPKPVEPPKAAKVVKEPKPGSVKDDARSFLRF
jgi:outer membrane biosynthesis protein TonB